MSTSMVKGNPLKLMVQFALPLLLGNLLQQTYNIIDAAIVGQILGAKAVSGSGFLHRNLCRFRSTRGKIFRRREEGYHAELHI